MIASKKSIKEADNIFFVVQGGVGRNIMATAVVRNVKRAFPDKKIIVLCGCPDVFLKNPHVDRVYSLGQPVFIYEDYFKTAKTIMLNTEPYQHYDYIQRNKHFVECWCEMLDIECDNVYPEFCFTEAEQRMAQLFIKKYDKPMVLLHGEGGKVPPQKTEKDEIIAKSGMYKRNLTKETMGKLTDDLIKKGYMVGCVCTPNQYLPPAAERINFPIRAIIALIPHVAGVIAIDSFLQHGTACSKKKSVVCWGGTDPKVLGYNSNINLTREVCDNPMCHRPNSYLFDLEPTGFQWDCPYNDKCMEYKPKEIMEAFDKITGGKDGRKRINKAKGKAEDTGGHSACGNKGCGSGQEDCRPDESKGSTLAEVPTGSGAN